MSITKYKVIDCDALNLRSTPGSNGRIIAQVEKGTILNVIDGTSKVASGSTWVQIIFSNKKLWCARKYLLNWSRAYRIVRAAITYSDYMIKNKWQYKNGSRTPSKTWAETKSKHKAGTCSYFVSWAAQNAGVIKNGTIITHTVKGTKPTSFSKVVSGKDNIINGEIIFPVNKSISDYKSKLKYGDIIVHDSSIEIYIGLVGGKPTVISGRNGSAINSNNEYVKMRFNSGYEFTHNILAIIRPKG